MSQENLEIVAAVVAAFNRGDLEALLSRWHPDGEYRAAIQQVVEGEAGAFRGHDGLREWWQELHDLYDGLRAEVLEVRDLGEQVVVAFVIHGRGKGSGVALGTPLAQALTIRQGKVTRARDYFSVDEALEAMGLSE